MNSLKVAVALRALADAFEEGGQDAQPPVGPSVETVKPRGRGRPAKGGDDTPASSRAGSPAATEPDPFGATEKPANPVATLDQVRAALTALKTASSQEKALAVLKKTGEADNITTLKPEKYDAVVAAVTGELKALEAVEKPELVEEDPFALPGETAAPAAKPATIEDVKAEIVAAQKRTSQDAVQKLVMQFGGKAKNPDTGTEGPSLKALPAEKYGETIAALKALPATK